ncbi:ATP-binding protein [Streptomyces sp. NBC_00829]|uniref:ATP-binding protein n=1 Tax=Streptomyces sp. NBC_00829 TaxID=2903679 RepID=UPI003868949D|nr:AAA family ATPase [Streptomyces sp. NBC_00829]
MTVGLDSAAFAWSGGFDFVGRRREAGLLLDAAGHSPALVLVDGEAGVGKSRLVGEATAQITEHGGRVATGYCHPLREPFPYGPVIDALRQIGGWLPPVAEIPPWTDLLRPLLPELADQLPPTADTSAAPQRHEVVRAVRALLQACGTLTVVVEDLHWADEATRELLLLLAMDLPPRLTLVLTYRRENAAAGPVLGPAFRRMPRTRLVEIHLEPLAEKDVDDLAAAVLGPAASPALSRALFERSAGLPLVVEEDLLTLSPFRTDHPGSVAADPVAALDRAAVPRGLSEAVAARMKNLTAPAVAIVEAAAVLAVAVEESLLTQLAGLDPAEGSDALVAALHAQVLRESGPMALMYGLRHTLAQQAVYQSIPGPRRRRLHERAITALRDLSHPPLVQIARHHRALGDHDGWQSLTQQAADQAIAVGDHGTAASLLHALLDEKSTGDDLRARTALALSRIALFNVDYTASMAQLRQILADPRLPTVAKGEIRVGLAALFYNQVNDLTVAREQLEQAVVELGEHRPGPAGEALCSLALLAYDCGRPDKDILGWIDRAERMVEHGDDAVAKAWVHADKLFLLAGLGEREVWPMVDQLPRDDEDAAVLRENARGLCNIADAALYVGHDPRVPGLLDDSQALADRLGHTTMVGWCRLHRLRHAWFAGLWADLEAKATALAADFPDDHLVEAEISLTLGDLFTARGQWMKALEHYGDTATKAFAVVAAQVAAGIGRIHLAQGHAEDAWTVTSNAMDELRSNSAWIRAAVLVPVTVMAALTTGRAEEAAQLAAELEHGIADRDAPAAIAYLHLCRGLLARDSHPDTAREQFLRAEAAFRTIGRPYPTAISAELAASTLIPAQPEEAARALTETAENYTRLGAVFDASRVRQTLRDLGQTPPSVGRRGYGDQLSPREHEVAQLLATGASNRDIARSLFLSPRTAEHHVASILRKLGVTDRTAVRDALGDREP